MDYCLLMYYNAFLFANPNQVVKMSAIKVLHILEIHVIGLKTLKFT